MGDDFCEKGEEILDEILINVQISYEQEYS
jgi:hypothetical protein